MPSVEVNIEEALMKKAKAVLPALGYPIAWPNMKFNPPEDNTTYLEVRHFPNRPDRYGLNGSDAMNRMGFLQVLVVGELNVGANPATELAGDIALLFDPEVPLWENGVKVTIKEKPSSMSASPTDTSWNVPVTVYYEASA